MVQDRKIRITRADKGGAIVVQDVDRYINEGLRLLHDPAEYDKVAKDPTPRVSTITNKLLDKLKSEEYIDKATHR